jgi:spore germination protein KC
MDFFIRAKETRPTTTMLISETTALDVLNVEPQANLLPAININKLVEAQVNNSEALEATVQVYINTMLSNSTSFVAPMISIEEQGEKKLLSIKGMAVFKEDKMVGMLNEDETRGLLWIKGDVQSGAINTVYNDQQIAIEIKSATTKVSPKIIDEKIIMHIDIDEEGLLVMQSGEKNVATPEDLPKISDCVEDVIEGEITMAFEKAKQLGCDIFGFGELLNKYENEQWEKMKDNWDELFKTVQLDMKIETNIRGAGAIIKPAVPETEGEKS